MTDRAIQADENAELETPPTGGRFRLGAPLLTFSGLVAAFGLASCCALPLFFAAAGISASWLIGIALLAAPYRQVLIVVAAATLLGGAVLLSVQLSQAAQCAPGKKCGSPLARVFTLVGLVIGLALLWAGYTYV